MTASDHPNCGINDVIEHSLKRHPERFADCLRSHARVHAEFADAYGDREVTQNELTLAGRLYAFANAIELGDTMIPNDDEVRGEAFGCAACLQALHPIMQSVIAELENARDAGPDDTRCDGRITTTGSWPFIERRRPGRANYMNPDLLTLLRGQTATKDDSAASGARDAAMNSRSAWPLMIRTTYDPEADVLSTQFGPTGATRDGHQEVAPGVYVEFDAASNPIAVKITSVRLRFRLYRRPRKLQRNDLH